MTGICWILSTLSLIHIWLIRHCYDLICQGAKDCKVYRAGGDEFVAVCADCGKEEFQNKVYQLRQKIKEDQCHMAVGYAWSCLLYTSRCV